MLTKLASLDFPLPTQMPAVFILIGQEIYQQERMALAIKQAWQQRHESIDSQLIEINNPADWLSMEQAANHYSLFSSAQYLDVRFSKASLDSTAKTVLERYLLQPNERCLILIRAFELPLKQLSWLSTNPVVNIILFSAPSPKVVQLWIERKLRALVKAYDPSIPERIYQYTEGSVFAIAQVFEKLACLVDSNSFLSLEEVGAQLTRGSVFSLYELALHCLQGSKLKCLSILRQAKADKTEATLILWILAQEIRTLLALLERGPVSFSEQAQQLKIWSSKVPLYQKNIQKYTMEFLIKLLQSCLVLDKQIKSHHSPHLWQQLDTIALALCTGTS